jgi:uncharacterized surface protein with fasciclin (FAS1) repeats
VARRESNKEIDMKKIVVLALTLTLGIAGAAWAGHHEKAGKDLVDTAVAAGSFKTLATALEAAGLVDTLKGEGPFTVFAPTDEAFAKLPAGTVEALLADKEKLVRVLTYHVVPGKVTAADVVGLSGAKTVEGGELRIDTSEGVRINGASVVTADVMASNGIIHVIDTVLIPE